MTANRTAERLALLGIALAAVSPATARNVEYRWASGPAMGGTIIAAIENAAGSAFRIYCEAGAPSPSPQGKGGFEYETKKTALRRARSNCHRQEKRGGLAANLLFG